MNGIKTEDLFIEASVDLDDGDNMPRNLARYARSSYSRKVLLKYCMHSKNAGVLGRLYIIYKNN